MEPAASSGSGFSVRLDEFEGPFDLLLSLIAKHRLDVTVLALHTVIDDFLAHIRARGADWDLDEATEFLVVAATLLDLKAARLLPSGEVEDEEDLALLEARDLLFARLLQYRAYKDVSAVLGDLLRHGARRHPREVGLDPEFAGLLPEVLIGLGPHEFAALAARALEPKPVATVSVSHIHAPRVSVREQAAILVDRLRRHPTTTFRAPRRRLRHHPARRGALPGPARALSRRLGGLRPGLARWASCTCAGPAPAEGDVVVRTEEYEGAPVGASRRGRHPTKSDESDGTEGGSGTADAGPERRPRPDPRDRPATDPRGARVSTEPACRSPRRPLWRPRSAPQDGSRRGRGPRGGRSAPEASHEPARRAARRSRTARRRTTS